jgi:hypothetical protein
MSRKIKFHTFNAFFQPFAYLADKIGCFRPQLLLGSVCKGGCRAASEQCFGTLAKEDPIINYIPTV